MKKATNCIVNMFLRKRPGVYKGVPSISLHSRPLGLSLIAPRYAIDAICIKKPMQWQQALAKRKLALYAPQKVNKTKMDKPK
jgi:hypothetical protein